jgi:putative solute:sodium symporter small subunit
MNQPDQESTSKGTTDVYRHKGENSPSASRHDVEIIPETKAKAYWRANVRLMLGLLVVWFVVSFGAGILFADVLNQFTFMGFPLGFWFAQQGSIYVFVLLIFIYTRKMHAIDAAYNVDDDEEPAS